MKKVVLLVGAIAIVVLGVLAFYDGFDVVEVELSKAPPGRQIEPSDYSSETVEEGHTILRYPLSTTFGLKPNNVVLGLGSKLGGDGVFVKIDRDRSEDNEATLVIVEGSEFSNGVIEVEVNGSVSSKASLLTRMFARGFIGIAFRIKEDISTFESFYIRPENGPTDDPERKTHAVQYFCYPDWNYAQLREVAPEQYEAAAPIAPGVWEKMRIEVSANTGKLFINDGPEPVLAVSDLKLGSNATGKVGLWVGMGTSGLFRDLKITRH